MSIQSLPAHNTTTVGQTAQDAPLASNRVVSENQANTRFNSPAKTRAKTGTRKSLGMTLVELLIVMVVIGILIGILVPVLGPILIGSGEFVIVNEVTQLDLAVEKFKDEKGFYPPDFTTINNINDLKTYLVKLAPNHTQTDAQLTNWMAAVGNNLGPSSSLVFWLSGLRNSAQFPLTLPDGTIIAAYQGAGDQEDRLTYFEFKSDRLLVSGQVAAYGQAKGNKTLPYIYFNSAYADVNDIPKSFTVSTGETVVPYPKTPGDFAGEFLNHNKTQIIAPGMDGRYGNYVLSGSPSIPNAWTTVDNLPTHRDNITNFVGGRLDKNLD